MKFQIFLTIHCILASLFVAAAAASIGGRGNIRGLATKFSGYSPRQMIIIKKILAQRRSGNYGRFA